MSDRVAKAVKKKKDAPDDEGAPGEPLPTERHRHMTAGDRQSLALLRREARKAGASLATGGKGGLPPAVVLEAMRRDGFRCKRCGSQYMLGVHHKGDVVNLVHRALRKNAHAVKPEALVTICEAREDGGEACHDAIHQLDRDVGAGKGGQVGHGKGETPDDTKVTNEG